MSGHSGEPHNPGPNKAGFARLMGALAREEPLGVIIERLRKKPEKSAK